jgi:hypothetical protein
MTDAFLYRSSRRKASSYKVRSKSVCGPSMTKPVRRTSSQPWTNISFCRRCRASTRRRSSKKSVQQPGLSFARPQRTAVRNHATSSAVKVGRLSERHVRIFLSLQNPRSILHTFRPHFFEYFFHAFVRPIIKREGHGGRSQVAKQPQHTSGDTYHGGIAALTRYNIGLRSLDIDARATGFKADPFS